MPEDRDYVDAGLKRGRAIGMPGSADRGDGGSRWVEATMTAAWRCALKNRWLRRRLAGCAGRSRLVVP